jgi:hypothetical protein
MNSVVALEEFRHDLQKTLFHDWLVDRIFEGAVVLGNKKELWILLHLKKKSIRTTKTRIYLPSFDKPRAPTPTGCGNPYEKMLYQVWQDATDAKWWFATKYPKLLVISATDSHYRTDGEFCLNMYGLLAKTIRLYMLDTWELWNVVYCMKSKDRFNPNIRPKCRFFITFDDAVMTADPRAA